MSAARAVGIGLVLTVGLVIFMLGILAVAGLFFFRMAAPLSAPQSVVIETESIVADPIETSEGVVAPPSEVELENEKPATNSEDFRLSVASVTRKPDGTCVILATAQRGASPSNLLSFQVFEAGVVEPPLACHVSSPAGPPYRNPIDLAIRTPVLPAHMQKIWIRYALRYSTAKETQRDVLFNGYNEGVIDVTLPPPLP